MMIEIDFSSDEAIYMQLRNQIVYGIATKQYHDGESLPSVRALADEIGINMHTVNKAYAGLRQEGLLHLDRRRGAVIAVDINSEKAAVDCKRDMKPIIAKGYCKGMSKKEMYKLIDELYTEFQKGVDA